MIALIWKIKTLKLTIVTASHFLRASFLRRQKYDVLYIGATPFVALRIYIISAGLRTTAGDEYVA
jgi:hypothetical protein